MKKINIKKIVLIGVSAASLLVNFTSSSRPAAAKNENNEAAAVKIAKNDDQFNGRGFKLDFKTYKANKKQNYVITTHITKKSATNVKAFNVKNNKTNAITAILYNSKNVYKLSKNSGRVIYSKHLNGARVNVSAWWNGKHTKYITRIKAAKRLNYDYGYNVNKHGKTGGVTVAMGKDAAE